jgi:hypothetical protein
VIIIIIIKKLYKIPGHSPRHPPRPNAPKPTPLQPPAD